MLVESFLVLFTQNSLPLDLNPHSDQSVDEMLLTSLDDMLSFGVFEKPRRALKMCPLKFVSVQAAK